MHRLPTDGVDRRHLFRLGGLAAASGLVIAACGEDDTAGTVTVPPRLGTAPEREPLPDPILNDVVILRTAVSLEYLAMETYDLVLAEFAGLFTGDAAALVPVVERFRADHQGHADAVSELIADAGGEPYQCSNERLRDLYVLPGVELIIGTEAAVSLLGIDGSAEPIEPSHEPLVDILALAHGLERLATATYQEVVPLLSEPALRRGAMLIAADETRHATVLAGQLAPGAVFPGPEGGLAAVPGVFGQLGQIPVSLGALNEVGGKTIVTLETPSLNALVFEYLGACTV